MPALLPSSPKRPRIAVVLGTRPEYLKLAPVVLELQRQAALVDTVVVLTGQHRELLHGLPELFELADCRQLGVANHRPDLASLTAALLTALDEQFAREPPQAVVVQGDTTTAFVAALAAFYRRIPVAHVEAGLRTYQLDQPFPEELNRQLVGRVATWHFPPTRQADAHLAAEAVPPEARLITGNTIVDTLQLVVRDKLPPDYAERVLPSEAPELAHELHGLVGRDAARDADHDLLAAEGHECLAAVTGARARRLRGSDASPRAAAQPRRRGREEQRGALPRQHQGPAP